MTREQIFEECIKNIRVSNVLLMQLATGTGKSKLAIDLINHLCRTKYKGKKTSLLLLVAKIVHKQTWKDEIQKWGGLEVDEITMECYESLRKHKRESFTFVLMDEVHHIQSETRLDLLESLKFDYMLGLSATIPRGLKKYFSFQYKAKTVSCDIVEAIEDDILPEPEILLLPLTLDNTEYSEELEVNPKAKGSIVYGDYRDLWRLKKAGVHAILKCTKKQKLMEMNKLILWEKERYMRTRNKALENMWLHHCGERLEFLSNCKIPVVQEILNKLQRKRTITFCKTIEQTEVLGKHCIHSKNAKSTEVYDKFNQGKINHITAVNILNENANLVNCKYAIFCNLSSSEVIMPQRCGRAMRHKSPVLIIPYYSGTREEEIVDKVFKDYDEKYIHVINSIKEI